MKAKPDAVFNLPVYLPATLGALFSTILIFAPLPYLTPPHSLSCEQGTPEAEKSIVSKVIDESGRGLSNAIIKVVAAGSPLKYSKAFNCDSEGTFEIRALKSGFYRLIAEVPAYVMAEDVLAAGKEELFYQPGEAVTLQMMKGGVITGTVTNSAGGPAVGARVTITRKGRSAIIQLRNGGEFQADDRGIYRAYGLPSGKYLVQAGGGAISSYLVSPYCLESSTFYSTNSAGIPSEVSIRPGEEVRNIDIRLHEQIGHAVSGMVRNQAGTMDEASFGEVLLFHAESGALEAKTAALPKENALFFIMGSIPDGRYLAVAQTEPNQEIQEVSSLLPVEVKGEDVSGLLLTMKGLGAVAGQIIYGQNQRVFSQGDRSIDLSHLINRILICAHLLGKIRGSDVLNSLVPLSREVLPQLDGKFLLNNLWPGRYHIRIALPSDSLYVKALELVDRTVSPKAINVAGQGLSIRQSEQLSGLRVVIAAGAATISGRVMPSKEGENLPGPMRIFLIPALEIEKAEDILRYKAVLAGNDYSYRFANVAPGQYWLLARRADWRITANRNTDLYQLGSATIMELRRIASRLAMKLTLTEDARIENHEIVFRQD